MRNERTSLRSTILLFALFAAACGNDRLVASPCNVDLDCEVGLVCDAGTCVDSVCGDGIVDPRVNEECDDQDTDNTDGCLNDCSSPLPRITILEPTRGATLSGEREITVRGTVDMFGAQMTSFAINGEPATLNGSSFETTMSLDHGLNQVKVEAGNEYNRTGVGTAGVYHSSSYLPFAAVERETPRLNRGVVSRLGQAALDDKDHPCEFNNQGVYECAVVDDLATVGELVLNNLNFEEDFGTLPIFEGVYPLFERVYPLGSTTIGSTAVISGTMALQGQVNLTVEVVALDFDRFRVSLDARDGELDVSLRAGGGPIDGVRVTVRTTAEVEAALRFTQASATLGGFDVLALGCLIGVSPTSPFFPYLSTLCIQGDGRRAPLAGVEPNAQLTSGLSVGEVSLFTQFELDTVNGRIDVSLDAGQVNFLDSTVDLDAIRDLLIDFDDVEILGGAALIDLGEAPLGSIAQGISTAVDPIADFLTNELQFVTQLGLSAFLLNGSDPLALGSVLESALQSFAPERSFSVTALSNGELDVYSRVDGVRIEAPRGGMATGGIEVSAASLYAGDKINPKTISGTLLRDDCYGVSPLAVLDFTEQSAVEQALSIDAMNQSLHAAWLVSALNGRVRSTPDAEARLGGSYDLTVDPVTPPIVSDCGGDIELQIADARVTGTLVDTPLDTYLSLAIPVDLGVGPNGGLILVPRDLSSWRWQLEAVGGDVNRTPLIADAVAQTVGIDMIAAGANSVFDGLPAVEVDLRTNSNQGLDRPILSHAPNRTYRSGGYQVRSGPRLVR